MMNRLGAGLAAALIIGLFMITFFACAVAAGAIR
jgi:hypothetical protein